MKNTLKKISLFALILVMGLSLVACTGDTDDGEGSDTPAEVTFTYAIGGEPDVLDPAVGADSVTSAIQNQIFFPLFSIGADG